MSANRTMAGPAKSYDLQVINSAQSKRCSVVSRAKPHSADIGQSVFACKYRVSEPKNTCALIAPGKRNDAPHSLTLAFASEE